MLQSSVGDGQRSLSITASAPARRPFNLQHIGRVLSKAAANRKQIIRHVPLRSIRRMPQNWRRMLLCVIIWFIGYAGMWAGKWVIAVISRGKAFLDELFHQIEFRVSATDLEKESVSRLSVLTKNFRTLFDIPYVTVMICCYVGIMMGKAVKYHRRISHQRLETGLLLYIPALVSVGWILLLTNHSSIHYWFTHRTLAPAVFCLLCAMDVIPDIPFQPTKR